eukprot:764449-Hanusia_phi.AAC.4
MVNKTLLSCVCLHCRVPNLIHKPDPLASARKSKRKERGPNQGSWSEQVRRTMSQRTSNLDHQTFGLTSASAIASAWPVRITYMSLPCCP